MQRLINFLILFFSISSTSQIGINTTTPDASSMLDITATNKGVLVPRVSLNNVTSTTLDGTNTAATGLLIWNTNAVTVGGNGVGFYFFNGVQWMPIVQSSTNHNTLDQAYDQGGAGVGRTITADAGAVLIQGTDGIQATGTFGSGTNLALSGAGTRMFFYPKKSAFRVGSVIGNEWDETNIGDYSSAIGYRSIASGENAVSIGYRNNVSGNDSFSFGRMNDSSADGAFTFGDNATATHSSAFSIGAGTFSENNYAFSLGYFTNASGENSFSIGNNNGAVGNYSFALGNENISNGLKAFIIGSNNTANGEESYAFGRMNSSTADGAFTFGDNANATHSSAFSIGAGTLSENNYAFSLGYFTNASGENSFSIGNSNGSVGNYSFALGNENISNGLKAFIIGSNNTANGEESYAFGRMNSSTADGAFTFGDNANATHSSAFSIGAGTLSENNYAFSLGYFTNASGENSFSIGNNNGAVGNYSFALGNENISTGNKSFTIGNQLKSFSIFETALGTNNTEYIPVDAANFNGKDRLLVVGNGTDNLNKSDAFIMLKSGDTRLNGNFGVKRDAITNALEVEGDASKTVAGSWLANSDARLKKDVVTINPQEALHKILQLRGVNYQWNDDKTGKKRPEGIQTGFIAQEIQEVFPEKVSTDRQGYLQTAYGDYDPIIFQAIKALYEKIEKLEKENQELKKRLDQK